MHVSHAQLCVPMLLVSGWYGVIFLSTGPYRRGVFKFYMDLKTYPKTAPKVVFTTPVRACVPKPPTVVLANGPLLLLLLRRYSTRSFTPRRASWTYRCRCVTLCVCALTRCTYL